MRRPLPNRWRRCPGVGRHRLSSQRRAFENDRVVLGIVLAFTSIDPIARVNGEAMTENITLLDLVSAVSEHACSEAEVIATVVYMVNEGHVRLCGTFKGTRFDLTTAEAA